MGAGVCKDSLSQSYKKNLQRSAQKQRRSCKLKEIATGVGLTLAKFQKTNNYYDRAKSLNPVNLQFFLRRATRFL